MDCRNCANFEYIGLGRVCPTPCMSELNVEGYDCAFFELRTQERVPLEDDDDAL